MAQRSRYSWSYVEHAEQAETNKSAHMRQAKMGKGFDMKQKMKRLLCILLACLMVVTPVYADNGKMGKKQKTKEQIEIEKAENEKKYQMFDKNGVRINLFFDHGKFSKTPAADVKKKAQTVSSDTKHLIIADLRYGKMCLFVYEGKKGKRKLIKAAPCSSAANIPGTKTTKTPAGSHKIGWKTDRLVYKNAEGKRWQYWSCSMTWQGWGIHSMTYHMSARYKYDRMYLLGGKLGAHNSPACIRTENSMADWIYKHCGRGTVIHVIR